MLYNNFIILKKGLKMRKIVSSLALASILVSGLYAQQGGANCDFRKDGKNSPMNQKDGKKMSKQN